MDTNVMNLYIQPEMGILLVALWVLGYLFKKSFVKDEFIPLILLVCGIIGACAIESVISVESVAQGILCCAVSVYGNQVLKQSGKNKTCGLTNISNNHNLAQQDELDAQQIDQSGK